MHAHGKQYHLHILFRAIVFYLLSQGTLLPLRLLSLLTTGPSGKIITLDYMSSFPRNSNTHFMKTWAFTTYSLKITVPLYFTNAHTKLTHFSSNILPKTSK